MSVAMTVAAELLAHPLSAMFAAGNEDLLNMTVVGFRIFSISFLVKGINTFASAFFTSLNNGLISGILSVLRALVFSAASVIAIPLIADAIWGGDAGLLGIWWAVTVAETLALIVSLIFLQANKKKYHY